jgi:hypothetical protein
MYTKAQRHEDLLLAILCVFVPLCLNKPLPGFDDEPKKSPIPVKAQGFFKTRDNG